MLVVAHDADHRGLASQCPDILDDVGGAAEPVVVTPRLDDRNRRLGGDSSDLAANILIEHEVADDQQPTPRKGVHPRLKPGKRDPRQVRKEGVERVRHRLRAPGRLILAPPWMTRRRLFPPQPPGAQGRV